jgi:hypothetical protein
MGQLGHTDARFTLSVYAQVIQRQRIDYELTWSLMQTTPTATGASAPMPESAPSIRGRAIGSFVASSFAASRRALTASGGSSRTVTFAHVQFGVARHEPERRSATDGCRGTVIPLRALKRGFRVLASGRAQPLPRTIRTDPGGFGQPLAHSRRERLGRCSSDSRRRL